MEGDARPNAIDRWPCTDSSRTHCGRPSTAASGKPNAVLVGRISALDRVHGPRHRTRMCSSGPKRSRIKWRIETVPIIHSCYGSP